MRDYSGKTIYLGMDVHKLSYSVTAICDGEIIKRDRLSADFNTLLKYCRRFFPGANIKSAYEAGFCGFELHRFLTANQIHNIIVHPASIEVQMNERVKTDKRDSLKIAVQLSQNRLKGIHIPSIEQEDRRSVSRMRKTLIKDRSRCVNRIKSFLHFHGHKVDFNRISKMRCEELKELDISGEKHFCFELLLNEWRHTSEKIHLCEQRLKQQSEADDLEPYYRSVPGVGATIARVLSNELGDMHQFVNERQLFSFCGLTPCEYSSGENIRRGHITRQGKPFLRMYLTQAAWRAIKKDIVLKEAFERISLRSGPKRAIQAIARKLVGRIRTCVSQKKFYEIGKH